MTAPLSDDDVRAAVVGDLVEHNATIELAEYDEEWPRRFEREAGRISGALGPKARQVEHAGSTSVPGLAAKPVIDIVLVVANSSDENAYVRELEAAGYVLQIREPDWFEHRLFKGSDTNVNLHTFSEGCEEVERMLAFRDWLRTHDDDRDLYLKCEARARDTRVEVRAELRGRKVVCGPGDTYPSPERVAVGIRPEPRALRGSPFRAGARALNGLRLPRRHTS